ncbi:MAG: hypothetical protein Kow0089_23190 [Desulfobulbaceae bacterium]
MLPVVHPCHGPGREQYIDFASKKIGLMHVKKKAFLLVGLVILVLSGFLLFEGIAYFNEQIDQDIRMEEELINRISNQIFTALYVPYIASIRVFVEEDPAVRKAFAARDRERLYELAVAEYFKQNETNPFFHAMDFNLPDGTVFLRVQKPELYGDNIRDSRPIVAAVHEHHRPFSGFDIGKHGAIFWVAHPVMHEGKYVGAVEFGIEIRPYEKALSESLGSTVTSVLKAKEWQKAELVKHGYQDHGSYVLMTRGDTLYDRIAGELDFEVIHDQWVEIAGSTYILHSCAWLKNFDGSPVGRLILFQDISPLVEEKRVFISRAVWLTLVALVVSGLVLYYSFGGLIGRLERFAEENRKAREELQRAHDTLEERVRERTVELAKSNARLEDEIVIRSRAEQKVDEQRRFFETLIESLSHPLYVIDPETYQVVLANRAACEITGTPSCHGMTCYGMTHHGSAPCGGKEHPCPLEEVKRTGKPVTVEHVHYDADNNELIFEIHAYPMFDSQGKQSHVIEYNLDITDRKQAEAEQETLRSQLFASQKMEAVGILAGGVAHDFNNILTTILGYSQIMAMRLDDEDPMRSMVQDIYDAAERATGLTRQLLAFSRKQVMETHVANLNDIVKNVSKMLGRLIGEDIEMRLLLADSIGNVKVDVGQIEQVIMNLVVNARDAMPDGGKLTIETAEVELDEQYAAAHHGVEPGVYSVLTVTDTGRGMSPTVQEKVFEPFFTTKKRGKGTGLGLSTVYGIVRQHKGHIYVYSEEGKGTTFKIYLPREIGEIAETAPVLSKTLPTGSERILVVDDDAAIRCLVRDTLEPLGYTVFEAGSGEDALAVWKKCGEEIDLVLTDLIMPGINGKELIETLCREQAGLKAILMSGYTDDIISRHEGVLPDIELINKPLLPISLANKVRAVLDAEGSHPTA